MAAGAGDEGLGHLRAHRQIARVADEIDQFTGLVRLQFVQVAGNEAPRQQTAHHHFRHQTDDTPRDEQRRPPGFRHRLKVLLDGRHVLPVVGVDAVRDLEFVYHVHERFLPSEGSP